MRRVYILYGSFYTEDGKSLTIGGIQTYIKSLIPIIKSINMIPLIYQYANRNFVNSFHGCSVVGVKVKDKWNSSKKVKVLYQTCLRNFDVNFDILIFATADMIIRNDIKRSICIQHGITWDVKKHENYSHNKNMLFILWKAILAWKYLRNLIYTKILVCVDYNFLNWYRTQVAYIENNVFVIPNCTDIPFQIYKPKGNVNIIFARRFQTYRGTRLFSDVIEKITKEYKNVNITFAGSGPDEKYLKEKFTNFDNVSFIKYDSSDSLKIHKNKHIAVIPTIGSEGTSLSLLEAMASKCAVIATNVGGMTNIVLDKYNGLLINPDKENLYSALEKLITDENFRNRISENAYKSVEAAFNKDIWAIRWKEIFEEIIRLP